MEFGFKSGRGFNTQPPEGGWMFPLALCLVGYGFNTQPPEGGWREKLQKWVICIVSTHSRLKAAGIRIFCLFSTNNCFNTQPPEGGWLIN